MASSSNGPIESGGTVVVSVVQQHDKLYQRIEALNEEFKTQFKEDPMFFVRVPGRVNLIGEHVDYCGYPVLPMAVQKCIIMAVAYHKNGSFLKLRNMDSKYNEFNCNLNEFNIEAGSDNMPPEWHNYFLCGIKGIYEAISGDFLRIGMDVVVSSDIPPAAGLSSSSALVSAAVLATARAQLFPLVRKELAKISAQCERYIGTQGGGMDQAIAFLAEPGIAQYIEFYPQLKATPTPLPKNACFVIANSLVETNKAASSKFNERVVECRLASLILAKRLGVANWRDMLRLKQLQSEIKCSLLSFKQYVITHLWREVYSRTNIYEELDIDQDELENEFLTPNTAQMTAFKLRQRALHVVEESLRVREFRNICNAAVEDEAKRDDDTEMAVNTMDPEVFLQLCKLMEESHESLEKNYECSHPDLDRLISISKSQGVGARLTGAGWGGCIVALCSSEDSANSYIQCLKELYYTNLPPERKQNHESNALANVVFMTFPSAGAEIFLMED